MTIDSFNELSVLMTIRHKNKTSQEYQIENDISNVLNPTVEQIIIISFILSILQLNTFLIQIRWIFLYSWKHEQIP